ncbi:hypothetical protein H6P81_010124 [Aristolochia fimbriata]|uniref:RRM domain-containing protein n=1 Tax=Aristolochia fimbriata TaxID=158543 RepID=A0AAV7EP40_ARIFI|nr:hypothetical protein H6P81_010124 [Aristolochia fimbriata]
MGSEMEDEKFDDEGGSRHTRIFVGGLGPAVTSSDLEKTFSTLGKVTRVEIIRTNGRNFGYMDFEPSSGKSLAKLFSMYNGCIWKGHYLVRLKKEWAEDAELVSVVHKDINSDKDASLPEMSTVATMEKKQLHIFFPRLRKVKLLPYSGSGKHKYSFQRIEVPSLPVHFCDCEEHSGHSAPAVEKFVSSINSGINEEELNIMNSVMNKLFGREAESEITPKATDGETLSTTENISNHIMDEAPLKDKEIDESSDEDNLLLNIATEGDSSRLNLMQLHGKRSTSVAKECEQANERTSSRRSDHQEMHDISNPRPKKKARRHMVVQSTENEFTGIDTDMKVKKNIEHELASTKGDDKAVLGNTAICAVDIQSTSNIGEPIQSLTDSQKSSWKELVGEPSKHSFSLSDVNPHEPMAHHEAQSGTQSKSEAEQPSTTRTWMQKSSWRDMVGQTSNTLFSISDILPSVKQKSSIISSEKNKPRTKKHQQTVSDVGVAKKLEEGKMEVLGKKVFTSSGSKAESSGKGQEKPGVGAKQVISKDDLHNEGDGDPPKETKANGVEEKKGKDVVAIGEVCSFMRNAASEREWMRAKAALSGSMKKKSNEDGTTKSSKSSSTRSFRGGKK